VKLTDTQRRFLSIAGLVVLLVYFGPSIIHAIHRTFAHAASPKPSPARPVQATPTPPPTPISPDVAERAKYLGSWAGSQLQPDQSTCRISLTLESSLDDQTKVAGHETKNCIPTTPFRGGKLKKDDIPTLIRETQPVYAELTGTLVKGDLPFTIDKIAGVAPGNCELTKFTVSQFGPGKLLAQWEEGKCGGGQMILTKIKA
jgi:hypothetical protein